MKNINKKKIIQKLNTDGLVVIPKLFSKQFCKFIVEYLNNKNSKINLPFSKVPWGYGNLINDNNFKKFSNNKLINSICTEFSLNDYEFNHLMVHNKAPWIGAGIEWHQEVFNINSYAPGYKAKDWKNFLQIYVPLEKQDLENGCLKFIPKSHKFGLLKHEDMVGDNFTHKRRVPFDIMKKIYGKNGIVNCILNPGDVIIFNHLIVHGSATNAGPRSRKAIVLQARSKIKEKNMKIFDKETKYRKKFVKNSLTKIISNLRKKNLYSDMKRKKS